MTFATSAVVMSEVAAAEAAATAAAIAEAAAVEGATATAAAAAGSGIEAAAADAAAQTALTSAAQTTGASGTTAASGINGANLANFSGNTMIDAGGSLMGESGGPLALPSAPAVPAVPEVAVAPEAATAGPVAAPATVPAPQGIEQIGTNQLNPYTGAPNYSAANNATQYENMITRNNASGMPGMPSTAPYGANYEQLSSVTNQAPSAFNTSAGTFEGVQATPPSALERGFGKVMDWAEKNPLTALYAGSTMANALFAPDEEEKKPNAVGKYKLSSNFQGSQPTSNVYRPQYQTFYAAEGGIAALAGGGYPMGMQDPTQYATPSQMPTSAEVINADYEPMGIGYKGGGIPAPDIDVGINNIRDDDFEFVNPYKAAASKLDKLYKASNIPQKAMATAPSLGAIDLTPAMMKKAAQGGIMGADSSLGGYAAGGNARLLRGPGDGMSDDIPATIANKQPARLADGEFVVPADVVSHLGNGSTEAGAKHLHGMMDKVRKARTGRKAQGKQINPKKFMPK